MNVGHFSPSVLYLYVLIKAWQNMSRLTCLSQTICILISNFLDLGNCLFLWSLLAKIVSRCSTNTGQIDRSENSKVVFVFILTRSILLVFSSFCAGWIFLREGSSDLSMMMLSAFRSSLLIDSCYEWNISSFSSDLYLLAGNAVNLSTIYQHYMLALSVFNACFFVKLRCRLYLFESEDNR